VLVDRSIHEAAYVELLVDAVQRDVHPGRPARWRQTTMGPLNNERTAAKAEHQVLEAIERGATLHAGGRRSAALGSPLFFEPTILDRVTEVDGDRARGDRSAGRPITAIDGEAEALEIIDGLAVWPADRGLHADSSGAGLRSPSRARAGWVNINEGTNYWESHPPFGGREARRAVSAASAAGSRSSA
jgi:succinate-semialdehyde dehydrogenase/glutarate-semialdehyde dehydrogenase